MTLSSARPRRLLALVVATGAVAALGPVAFASTATASTATAPTVAACPKKSGSLSFKSTLANGVTKLGSNASITGSTATACGLLAPTPNGKEGAIILPKNIQFAPVTTKSGPLSFPTTLKATSPLTGPVAYTPAGQTATFTGSVLATADIMGQQCQIPLKVALTTGKSGSLTGTPFHFDKKGVSRGKLVANNFPVPAITSSSTCNVLVATLSNTLLGLPLAAGASSITYDGSLQLT